jgi:hypothetical protein
MGFQRRIKGLGKEGAPEHFTLKITVNEEPEELIRCAALVHKLVLSVITTS